ncbi:MAG: ATP-binding protein, partial [Candidatus Humimicrobiaceae bacterium]
LRFLPDRIRIENYWQKPSRFVLGKTVFRRNQVIADLFSKIHFGEKMGTGFERIKEICEKENSPFPEIELEENYFYVTFRQSREYLQMAEKETKIEITGLNERQKEVLDYLKEIGKITTMEYVKITRITRRTAIRDLNDMVDKKILRIVGGKAGRQRYYVLL